MKDSNGWAETFQQAAAALPLPRPTITLAELTDLDNRFWVMFWDIYRLLLRGDSAKSFPIYLQLTHFTLSRLIELLPVGNSLRQTLAQVRFGPDNQTNIQQMNSLLHTYIQARQFIVLHFNLPFTPNRAFEDEIRRRLK